ncbi:SRPBCC family protein [Chryseolinea lacunae]|uniref:SRPBCC domain-containing protein n=1 Tax=Chryseolinea lacunae TaxID=2801331 RepID=A0ABS1KLM3_9BACT|nr:SRPBCC domain-containing protein [Chryseolinea lacunae]MBL0740351.1 SRPBCC domain-containing protein [Chryseolinea lacunae]
MCSIKHLLTIQQQAWPVYASLTTLDGLAQWWTPNVNGEPDEGGTIRFYFDDYYKEMQVMKNDPAEKVVWRCTEGVEEWIDTIITFQIIKTSEQACTLVFNHDKWVAYSRMFYQCSYDWAMFLRSLKRYHETGKGQPFPDQHAWELPQ